MLRLRSGLGSTRFYVERSRRFAKDDAGDPSRRVSLDVQADERSLEFAPDDNNVLGRRRCGAEPRNFFAQFTELPLQFREAVEDGDGLAPFQVVDGGIAGIDGAGGNVAGDAA